MFALSIMLGSSLVKGGIKGIFAAANSSSSAEGVKEA
jgi:hypothetical protein